MAKSITTMKRNAGAYLQLHFVPIVVSLIVGIMLGAVLP